MKGVIVASALFVVALFFCIFSGVSLNKIGREACNDLNKIEELAKESKWDEALKETEKLQANWEKNIKWITTLIDHRETDEVNETLYALKEYIIYEEKPEMMATAATLQQMLMHIPLKEKLKIENIF